MRCRARAITRPGRPERSGTPLAFGAVLRHPEAMERTFPLACSPSRPRLNLGIDLGAHPIRGQAPARESTLLVGRERTHETRGTQLAKVALDGRLAHVEPTPELSDGHRDDGRNLTGSRNITPQQATQQPGARGNRGLKPRGRCFAHAVIMARLGHSPRSQPARVLSARGQRMIPSGYGPENTVARSIVGHSEPSDEQRKHCDARL